MKNKFYKLLSIMLTVAVVLSCFVGVLSVSAATSTTVTYYVSASGSNDDDGSEETPFQTIGGALTKAVAAADAGNYNIAESTVYLKLLGTDAITYSDASNIAFNFKLNISSATSGALLDNGAKSTLIFGGPVVFENLSIQMYLLSGTGDEYYLNGENVTFGSDVTWLHPSASSPQTYFCTGASGAVKTVTETQTINFYNSGKFFQYFTLGGGKTTTYDADLNLIYTAPGISQDIKFDTVSSSAVVKYNKNVNLDLREAGGVNLVGRANNARISFGADSAVQILNSTGKAVTYDANIQAALFGDAALTDTYVITNDTGVKDILSFTGTAGTYTIGDIPADHVLYVTPKGGEAYTPDSSTVKLQPGEYTLTLVDTSAKPKDVTYYVSASGSDDDDGSEATPFQTIGGALTKAITAANIEKYNLAESNVYLKLLGTYYDSSDNIISANGIDLTSASGMSFNFKLVIATDESLDKQCGLTVSNGFTAGGDIDFKNVTLHLTGGSKSIYFNGKNVKMDSDVKLSGLGAGSYFTTGSSSGSATVFDDSQTVYYTNKANSGTTFQFFTVGSNGATTYNGDLNFIYDAPSVSDKIMLDAISKNTFSTVNKNMNIHLVSGSPRLTTRNIHSASAGGINFGDKAAFQMINSTGNTINYSDIETFLPAKKYIITNLTGVNDIISFTETAGTYNVKEGYKVTAIAPDKTTKDSENGQLVLQTSGEYKLIFEITHDASTDNYSEYIVNRGNGLKNTYAKLANKEDINVAYFGGSVTGGTGVDAPDADSWRAKIGSWLVNNFPISNINNINLAYGGTGTLFGVYRTEAELLAADPDLVFIDFAVNDMYDGASYDDAKMRFETIVRKIRAANPKCDIVTILVSEKSKFTADLSDELYGQAKAHDDISAAYGIPSIYVGRALADTVANIDNWGNYYSDGVHPNVDGYEVFYQVIKEYLNNELVYGSGTEADHTVPEQVSTALYDGDITVIDVTADFIAQSEALGGYGFEYLDIYSPYRNIFYGGAQAHKANPEFTDGSAQVVFKFTGTELGFIYHFNYVAGCSVKIDDGEFYTVNATSTKPMMIASGLESKEHTVTIKPIYNDSGSVHFFWINAFFTRDITKSSHTHNYGDYVSNGDATCTQDGTKSAICSICLNTDTVADTGSAGHKFINYVSDGNATCTQDGTKTAICDREGCEEPNTIPDEGSAGHIFENYVSNKDATCVKDGTKTATCEREGCGVKSDPIADVGSKLGHKNTKITTVKATTTADGYVLTECSVCGTDASKVAIKYVKSFSLSTTSYTYDGKAKTPSVTVKDSSGKTLKKDTDFTVTYPSGRIKKGTYTVKVTLKGNYSGTKSLTFKINACKSSKLKLSLSTTSYTYNGSAKKPSVTVKLSSTKLKKDTDYEVTYPSGRKKVGSYKVKIKFKGNYTGTEYLTFKINPGKTSVSKLTAAKKSLKVTIKKKTTQTTGYQIQYSTSKTFKEKYTKSKTIKSNKTTSVTIKSLKAKKTYYVRVRTYKTVNGKKYYSGWSTYKTKKTK